MGEQLPQELADQLPQYDRAGAGGGLGGAAASFSEQGLLFTDDDYIDPAAAMALPQDAPWSRPCACMSPTTATCAASTALPPRATSAPDTA